MPRIYDLILILEFPGCLRSAAECFVFQGGGRHPRRQGEGHAARSTGQLPPSSSTGRRSRCQKYRLVATIVVDREKVTLPEVQVSCRQPRRQGEGHAARSSGQLPPTSSKGRRSRYQKFRIVAHRRRKGEGHATRSSGQLPILVDKEKVTLPEVQVSYRQPRRQREGPSSNPN